MYCDLLYFLQLSSTLKVVLLFNSFFEIFFFVGLLGAYNIVFDSGGSCKVEIDDESTGANSCFSGFAAEGVSIILRCLN